MKDYYEILEVHPKASQEVIKEAYQTIAKLYHPDLTAYEKGFAHEKLTELNEAYSVLSDSDRRKEYDNRFFGNPPIKKEEPKMELTEENKNRAPSEAIIEKPIEQQLWYRKIGSLIGKGVAVLLMLFIGFILLFSVSTRHVTRRFLRENASPSKRDVMQQNLQKDEPKKQNPHYNLFSPNNPDWKKNKGRDYASKGDFEKAIDCYTEAIKLDPTDGEAYYWRGMVEQMIGENENANSDFAKAKKYGYEP